MLFKKTCLFFVCYLFISGYFMLMGQPAGGRGIQHSGNIRDTAIILKMAERAFDIAGSNHEQCRLICDSIIEKSKTTGYPSGVAIAFNIKGNLLRTEGQYNDAIDLHLDALRIFDSVGDHSISYISCLVNTGTDYFFLKNEDKALFYYNKALPAISKTDYRRITAVSNNIGMIYHAKGEYDKAIGIFTKALPSAMADSSHHAQATLLSSLGISLAAKGNKAESIDYLKQALVHQKTAGVLNHYAATCNTLAGMYIDAQQYQQAEQLLQEGYRTAIKVNAKSVVANYYRNMGLLCSKTNRLKEAYEWQSRYIYLNDSLINDAHIKQLAESENRYLLDLKNQELVLARLDNELKKSEIGKGRLWRFVLGGSLLGALFLVVLLYINFQLKKKANNILLLENEALQSANTFAKYETLKNQVNPHFLFNCLNTLNSLIDSDRTKAQEFIAVFSRVYRNILEQNHHHVIQVSEEMKLTGDYIYLQKIRFGNCLVINKNISVAALQMYIPPFSLQMLIENAIKHNMIDEDKPLTISILSEGEYLIVSNNLQPRGEKIQSTGMGLKNITDRYRFISNELPDFDLQNNLYVARIPLLKA